MAITGGASSSGSQTGFPPTNAIDNSYSTKWFSSFISNPWIKANLGAPKTICGVDITWSDGASREYTFSISVSTDNANFNTVFSGNNKRTSTAERYSFADTTAQYVKITITKSHTGSANSIAQISEIDVFGKTAASSITNGLQSNLSLPSASTDSRGTPSGSESGQPPTVSPLEDNHPPSAKDDRFSTEANNHVVSDILGNDIDADGDKLNVVSVSSPTKEGGIVTINDNRTITFLPAVDFAGVDAFSYLVSDGKGKIDEGQVLVIVRAAPEDNSNNKRDQPEQASSSEPKTTTTTSSDEGQGEKEKQNAAGLKAEDQTTTTATANDKQTKDQSLESDNPIGTTNSNNNNNRNTNNNNNGDQNKNNNVAKDTPSDAAAQIFTTKDKFSIDEDMLVPCANNGEGETFHFRGTLNDNFHITYYNHDQFLLKGYENVQAIKSIGQKTDDTYQGTGASQFQVSGKLGVEHAVESSFRMIDQTSGNNLKVYETLLITVNPDKTVTSLHDNFKFECN
jgi:hypothetical protein